MTLYVLWWRYFDGSGAAPLRVYKIKASGQADLEVMRKVSSDREWKLEEVPYIGYGETHE